MKTTLTLADLTRRNVQPTLKGLDDLMVVVKTKCPAEQFPELKLSKTYRFTTSVLRKYAVSALEVYMTTTSEAGAKLLSAYTDLDVLMYKGVYVVDDKFATVVRSKLYELRNAIKELSPLCTEA